MMTTTPRLGLPLIEPGQAQKELFHNESLLLIDAAVQAGVTAAGMELPPSAPASGDCWVVGAMPVDAWSGHPHALAMWTAGGWRFVAAREGMAVWERATGCLLRYRTGMWLRGNAILAPTGGATVDEGARQTLAAVIGVLRNHGLVP
jgi:hypothetical protein